MRKYFKMIVQERIRNQEYGRPSDVWSIGCVAHELFKTDPPFIDLGDPHV